MPSVSPLIYIRSALSEGRSANSAYREMRQAVQTQTQLTGERWTGIGRQSFLQLYGQTLAARNKVGNALDYNIDLLPDQSVTTPRTVRYGNPGYITWLTIYTRQQGEPDIEARLFAVSHQQPITPSDAMAKARQGFEDEQTNVHGTLQGQQFIGATYSGTWQTTRAER